MNSPEPIRLCAVVVMSRKFALYIPPHLKRTATPCEILMSDSGVDPGVSGAIAPLPIKNSGAKVSFRPLGVLACL